MNDRPIHHVCYIVDDIRKAVDQWVETTGAGPFHLGPHVEFEETLLEGESCVFAGRAGRRDRPREGALARRERLEERSEYIDVLLAPQEALGHDRAHRLLSVHGARVDVGQHVLAREAPSGLAVTLLLTDEVEQVAASPASSTAKSDPRPSVAACPRTKRVRHRMERAPEDPLSRAARQRVRARKHVPRCAASERQQQDPLGGTPPATSEATRAQSVVVFPVPAPASTSRWPSRCSAAARCSGFNSSSQSAVLTASVAANIGSPNATAASGRPA
jgi:catechol 2,3-dioxygenase-like lactoylglutathione lyase family enzyme